MGIRDKPIAPGSPWQNGYAERLIADPVISRAYRKPHPGNGCPCRKIKPKHIGKWHPLYLSETYALKH